MRKRCSRMTLRTPRWIRWCAGIAAAFAISFAASFAVASEEAGLEYFEKHVRPVLVTRCYECHSGEVAEPKGGLRVDSRPALLKGGDTGPAIVPGKPAESLLIDAINYGDIYQMPPKSKMPAEEIAALAKWVEMGAPWPKEDVAASSSKGSGFDLAQRKSEHWCWQPIRHSELPAVENESWIEQPLDRFILAKLESRGLAPSPRADSHTLVRRLHFDLIGLPPTPEEVQRFIENDSPGAYAQLVDRLLDSPHFGERWGRHWLDLVRYAESRGHEFDYNIPGAFEYRDYVVRALNADVPYDRFVVEHIAGDLIQEPRLHPTERWNESILGTGFWFLGEAVHSPVDIRKDECDRVDNMLDVFSKTFLGLTVACARCHDHKFDAISQADYYALAGYVHSSSYRLARFTAWEEDRRISAELADIDGAFRPQLAAAMARALRPHSAELAATMASNLETLAIELGVDEVDLRGAEVIVDYANLPPQAWMTDGPTWGSGPVAAGQIVAPPDSDQPVKLATDGSAQRDAFVPDLGIAKPSENEPGRLSGFVRSGRTLKTPTWTLTSGKVHYLIEGVGHVYAAVDSHVMVNGPLHGELVKDTGGDADLPARWITHDLTRYAGHRVHLEFCPRGEERFRVLKVVEGETRPAPPAPRENQLFQELIAAKGSKSDAELQSACRELIAETLQLLENNALAGQPAASDRAVLMNWMLAQCESRMPTEFAELLARYRDRRKSIAERLDRAGRLAPAMWASSPVDEHLLIRGNPKTTGPVVVRRNLEALGGPSGVGRLELAESIVDPANPLVSRVLVNRVWHHLLGRGIVPSTDNFGVLGQEPTHPELLDYLASEFMRDGWSLKRLIRRIVLSSTYQQSARAKESDLAADSPAGRALSVDPQNLLFHRQNIKRLEGEALRDAMLAISGRLDRTMYGPSVPVHLTQFMQGRGRPSESGPLDGGGRRSVYIAVRRNFLSPMMLAFDTPAPFTTMGRRNVSNVPAQALILMNDPFVSEQAKHWARRIIAADALPEGRIRRMYREAFSREPAPAELMAAQQFLDAQATAYDLAKCDVLESEQIWSDLGHVLWNVKEFAYVD